MASADFFSLVRQHLDTTSVESNLVRNGAVVLERIARGGGATNWYYCKDSGSLRAIERRLSPGGCVSFYFDDRIRVADRPEELRAPVQNLLDEFGECVVGYLGADSVSIEVDFVTSAAELQDFALGIPPSSLLFFGPFPARDDDGIKAITLTLPDGDGVVRRHPH